MQCLDSENNKMKKDITVIGCGKVGLSFAEAFSKNNSFNLEIFAYNQNDIDRALNILSVEQIKTQYNDLFKNPKYIIIAVADKQIPNVVEQLQNLNHSYSSTIILHAAGAYNIEPLLALKAKGADVATMHPYQTFIKSSADLLKNVGFGIECEDKIKANIEFLVKQLGGIAVFLPENISAQDKAIYHASAVSISNFMTVLFQLSERLCGSIGLDPKELVPTIARQTIENNISYMGKEDMPMTGPIGRGDVETVMAQLSAMQDIPEAKSIYSILCKANADIAYQSKLIDDEKYKEMMSLLDE